MTEFERALDHYHAGRLKEAEALYREILARQPKHPDALHLLGVSTAQSGNPQGAVALIEEAIDLHPWAPEYHNNLGEALRALHQLDAAIAAYHQALTLRPGFAEAHNNLGLALQAQGHLEQATAAYQQALALMPEDPEILSNLGTALKDQGMLDEAIATLRRALALAPDYAEAHNNLGAALERQRRLPDAISAYRQAIALEPSLAEAHHNLGVALEATGQIAQAVDAYRHALQLRPEMIDAWRGIVAALRSLDPTRYEPALEADLKACFAAPQANAQYLVHLAANQLRHKHHITDRLHAANVNVRTLVDELGSDELLLTLLEKTLSADPVLEQALTAMRQWLLLTYHDGAKLPPPHLALAVALGQQCFSNEFVLDAGADEAEIVERLTSRCAQWVEQGAWPAPALEHGLALLALYRPLFEMPFATTLNVPALAAWSEPIRPLIERAVKEPLEEAAIEHAIESLGEIEDATSKAVRAQYEEHPYPRWVDLPRPRTVDLATFLHHEFPHFSPPPFFRGSVRMLVARCGSGQQPIAVARQRPETDVLAVDLSRRSLAYAIRIARKLDVTNIRFLQADILTLPRLQQRFQVIECAGVLHHMAEPLRGWRILADLLVPGGVMRIGLYSERAREPIVAARRRIQELGLTPAPQDIKLFRKRILSGQEQALKELTDSKDLYSISTCRDLLFHVNEHRFTLPQIRQALDELGLTFIGFELEILEIKRRYDELYPDDPQRDDLMAWERFEQLNPRAFAGMYTFWCQKKQ
ncbi:MAG: tetratricopeptide repeat protein [Acidiferrobacterales bacterium]